MPIKIEVRDGHSYAKVADLHNWKDNPKTTSKEDGERLKKQIELGEHSTMLIEPNGNVLGGNSRLRMYKTLNKREAKVIVVEFIEQKGKVHAVVDGIKAERVFDSIGQARLEYALSHNDLVGAYDDGKLAELLTVTPIPMEVYKVTSVVRPVEDVAFEAGNDNPDDRPEDEDTTDTTKLDAFMNGSIKQIVLYFDNEQYENVIPRIEGLRAEMDLESTTDLFLALLTLGEGRDVGAKPSTTNK